MLGHIEFVTSTLFDVGVYLVVIGLVLDVLRSLGAEVDRQAQELRDGARRAREEVRRLMDVSLVLIVIMAVLFACGVYAMLERSLTRVLIGFLLLGNATNLLLLIVMGQPGHRAVLRRRASTDEMSDPLPQALTLTAIVITFAVSAFLLALIYRSWQLGQADTVEDDEADIAVRARATGGRRRDGRRDRDRDEDDDATTDFVGIDTAPITSSAAATSRASATTRPTDPPDGPPRRRDGGAPRGERRR